MIRLNWHSLLLFRLLLLDSFKYYSESRVVDLPVCTGERLDLECVSTGLTRNDFIDWNVTIIQDTGSRLSDTRLISAAGQSVIHPITLNMINFIINSTTTEAANGSNITLTSFMSVSNVTSLLNGTEISCSEVRPAPAGDNLILPVREAVIYVITTDNINPAEVNGAVPTFGPDSVIVTVTWQQERGASYNVSSVLPQVVVNMSGPATLQLTLEYNTLYNVTIATIVCGQTLFTTVTQLHYVDCGEPGLAAVGVFDLMYNSTLEGSMLVFWCASLNSTLTAFCLKNGEWSPNPTNNLLCSTDTKRGTCVSELLMSYVIVYIVVIVILMTALFTSVAVNICFCLKRKLSTKTSHDQGSAVDLSRSTQPIYETAVAVVETTTQEEEVDMEKNVAYAPIQRTSQL